MSVNLFIILVFAAFVMVLIFAPGWRRSAEMRRTCRDCGAGHPAFARFCRRCGKRL
jgi:hypothetical protein